MNLLEMADEVLARVGGEATDAALPVATRKSFVKAGVRAVEVLLDNPYWLQAYTVLTTVAGDNSYATPAGWAKTISLRLVVGGVSGVPSEAVLPFQSAAPVYEPGGAGVGTPRTWTTVGALGIILHPTPNAVLTYEHRYTKAEPTLTADADTPLLPARFHDVIVEKACALACRRIGDLTRAAAHQKEFELLVPAVLLEQERGGKPPRLWARTQQGAK